MMLHSRLSKYRLLPKNKNRAFPSQNTHHARLIQSDDLYDKETGQVYTETTSSVQHVNHHAWSRQSRKNQHFRAPSRRGVRGSSSLQSTAVETLLLNISDVTFEGLESIPVNLLQPIWKEINQRGLVCFELWYMFSRLLRHEETATMGLMRYQQAFEEIAPPLKVYLTPLVSPSFDFISSLSITVDVSVPDLVKLSQIVNLGVLEIVSKSPLSGISNRLIRSWSTAAKDGAFRVLRILKLWGHKELTTTSLIYLNDFWSLAVYDVRGCHFDTRTMPCIRELGWKCIVSDYAILEDLEGACAERAKRLHAHPKSPFVVRKTCPSQIPDTAKIVRVKRSEMLKYFQMPVENTARASSQAQAKCTTKKWDFVNYTMFSRVGELRNDMDLRNAGIELQDQAIATDGLISSVPIVSIRLGPTPMCLSPLAKRFDLNAAFTKSTASFKSDEWRHLENQPGRMHSQNLLFLRLKVPPRAVGKSADPSFEGVSQATKMVHGKGIKVGDAQTASSSGAGSVNVKAKKKRKLDDILGDFY